LKHQIGSLRSEGNTMRERMPPEQRKVDPASELMGTQMEHRQRIREQWKKDAGDLIDAHMFATSVVANMTSRISGRRFERQSKEIEGRLTLTAQFIQGIEICEVAISEALYSQAAALLKQELETLAAIDEFEKDRRKNGKTPNVGTGAMRAFGPIYGDLNNIAHPSRDDIARNVVLFEKGEICGPSAIPQYNQELARFLYGNHVYFIISLAVQIKRIFREIFDEGFSKEEEQWLLSATMILLREKVVKLPPEATEDLAHFIENFRP
jgi:hypothetical protein